MEQRARVVVGVGASVDGKVALNRETLLMREPAGELWRSMAPAPADPVPFDVIEATKQRYGCNAVLEGSGSLVADDDQIEELPLDRGDHDELYAHHLPADIVGRPSPPQMWFTTVDSRGRVRWDEEHPDWDVLVLVSRSTPPDYLAYLRRNRICYLVVGADRVDLEWAMRAMKTELGIDCVLSTAGGGLNGALLRAGLIDELYLTLQPALVGGLGTPSIMDGTPLGVGEAPTPLRLLSVHADRNGAIRLHCEVAGAS